MNLETKLRDSLILAMVQRNIFCPITGSVLDVRTVKYFVDSDGDPAYVMSPEAYDAAVSSDRIVESLATKGLYPSN